MQWNEASDKAISKMPFFLRKRVKRRVEEEATRCGAHEVSMDHVRTCQARFLNRMEDDASIPYS